MNKYILYLFIFCPLFLLSQRTVTVSYQHPISDDYSYNQEVERALKKAKEEALRKAGIGENITSYSTLSTISNNDDFSDRREHHSRGSIAVYASDFCACCWRVCLSTRDKGSEYDRWYWRNIAKSDAGYFDSYSYWSNCRNMDV